MTTATASHLHPASDEVCEMWYDSSLREDEEVAILTEHGIYFYSGWPGPWPSARPHHSNMPRLAFPASSNRRPAPHECFPGGLPEASATISAETDYKRGFITASQLRRRLTRARQS